MCKYVQICARIDLKVVNLCPWGLVFLTFWAECDRDRGGGNTPTPRKILLHGPYRALLGPNGPGLHKAYPRMHPPRTFTSA